MLNTFRELTAAEVELVAGGTEPRTYQGTDGHYYRYGDTGSWGNSWGWEGSSGGDRGYDTDRPPEPPPAVPSDFFKLSGHTDCPTDVGAFNTAVTDLVYASPLAKKLFDAALKDGYTFDLEHNNTDWDDPAPSARVIHWDPFSAIMLRNDDGTASTRTQSPLMGLIHELAHVYLFGNVDNYTMYNADGTTVSPWGNAEEKYIIENYENVVAADINRVFGAYGMHEDTRTNHFGDGFITTTVEKASPSGGWRPDCG